MTRPLRLLLVTDAVGGVWTYSLELAHALAVYSVEVMLAVFGPAPSHGQREQARGLRLIETGLPLEWMPTNPADIRRAGQTLSGVASREKVDLVQTCSAPLLADVAFPVPTIAVQHSCVASWWAAVRGTALPPEFRWRRDLIEGGLNNADAIVAPSIAFAAETARIYDVSRPVLPVHNGRQSTPALGIPQSDFVFTASRLWDEGKNIAVLDAAAALLDAPFEAAGPLQGPNGTSAEYRNLRLMGEIGGARLAELLAARPIYASTALYEPFGLSVLEAANAGCALVLSDIPTFRELWGDAAVFVPARDADAFAAACQELLDDRDMRVSRGRAARSRAQVFTPSRMAQKMAAIYQMVLGQSAQQHQSQLAEAAA
ncbi:MAG TPA: glycosyltransferase family 4 protein [Sphingomicrobium sp.]|jgi:glycosyltransferase involved in cell wall biosynthesis